MNRSYEEKWDRFHPKIIALTLFVITPVGLSGCSSSSSPPVEPVYTQPKSASPPSSNSPLTAFDECEWERETNGWNMDCGDNDIDWYREHGYTTKHSYVPSSSLFYRKMRGSDVSSVSSVKENKSAPAPSSSTPIPAVSGKGTSGTTKSPALTPTTPARSGVGSGGTSTGGFSTGG